MIGTIFEGIFMAMLVGALSYALYFWSHAGGLVDENGNLKKPKKKKKKSKKNTVAETTDPENSDRAPKDTANDRRQRKTGHFALDKWISMGGGYYGTVALMKLILLEIGQAIEFVSDVEGMIAYFKNFGLHSVIEFFVDQIKTFVEAIIWPTEYFGHYSWLQIAVLFALTYGAYKWAQRYARQQHQKAAEATEDT